MFKKVCSMFLAGILITANISYVNAESIKPSNNHVALLKSAGDSIQVTLPTDSQLIKTTDDALYYVENNQLIKIEKDNNFKKASNDSLSASGIKTATINEKFNLSQRNLDENEITLLKSNPSLASAALTYSDQNMDSTGAVLATLSVQYSVRSGSDAWSIYSLYSASGSAVQLHNEGVVPQSSQLYWSGLGNIYKNGIYQYRGTIGFTRSLSPSFSNYQLMDNGVELEAQFLDIKYTVYCKRGVSIVVGHTFA